MNRSFRFAPLASVVPVFALVACSAAPAESTEDTTEALPIQNDNGGGDPTPTPRHPSCMYSYADDNALPPELTGGGRSCAWTNISVVYSGRDFDTTVPFEAWLKSMGCKSARQSTTSPVTGYTGQNDFSIALCPDSCGLWTAGADYRHVAPIYAMTTKTTPVQCLVNDGAGHAPPGWTYTIWDPKCPSGCAPVMAPPI